MRVLGIWDITEDCDKDCRREYISREWEKVFTISALTRDDKLDYLTVYFYKKANVTIKDRNGQHCEVIAENVSNFFSVNRQSILNGSPVMELAMKSSDLNIGDTLEQRERVKQKEFETITMRFNNPKISIRDISTSDI